MANQRRISSSLRCLVLFDDGGWAEMAWVRARPRDPNTFRLSSGDFVGVTAGEQIASDALEFWESCKTSAGIRGTPALFVRVTRFRQITSTPEMGRRIWGVVAKSTKLPLPAAE